MMPVFEELDFRSTRLGQLVLRRRTELTLGVEVFEVKLNDEFLMSSLFTEGEIALARHALLGLGAGPLDVAVAGLGLGYTAQAVLEHLSVGSLLVVEALEELIDWHRRGLVPLGQKLTADRRCELLHADFFARVKCPALHPEAPGKRYHAIVVDIDHSPRHVLHPSHADFYDPEGLRRVTGHLLPGGTFALWSNDPPDELFCACLREAFATVEARIVAFHNPLTGSTASNTVYLACTRASTA